MSYVNKHAPIKFKCMLRKPKSLWMTPEIIKSKRRRRYLIRVWRKSRSSIDMSCRRIAKSKSDYYETIVSINSAKPQQLQKCINQIFRSLLTHELI